MKDRFFGIYFFMNLFIFFSVYGYNTQIWYFIRSLIHHFVIFSIWLLFIFFSSFTFIRLMSWQWILVLTLFSFWFPLFFIRPPHLCPFLLYMYVFADIDWSSGHLGDMPTRTMQRYSTLYFSYSIILYSTIIFYPFQIVKRMTHWIIQYCLLTTFISDQKKLFHNKIFWNDHQ